MSMPVSRAANAFMRGPLAPYARGFAAELGEAGYTRAWVTGHLAVMRELSGWLAGEGPAPDALSSEPVAARFVHGMRPSARPRPTVRTVGRCLTIFAAGGPSRSLSRRRRRNGRDCWRTTAVT